MLGLRTSPHFCFFEKLLESRVTEAGDRNETPSSCDEDTRGLCSPTPCTEPNRGQAFRDDLECLTLLPYLLGTVFPAHPPA